MPVLESEIPEETVAVGDLFKLGGSQGGRRTWNLRRFYLAGIYLSYYSRSGKKKGQWDIRGCSVRKTTPEECKMPDALYAFALVGKNKFYVMCASNERSRAVWIRCIGEQIEEFKVDIRQHIRRGEVIVADEKVRKKGGLLGTFSTVRLVITNFPKIMVIDPRDCILKEQLSWGKADPPKFTTINEKRFKISLGSKDMQFEDEDKGSVFWETLFRRFPDVELFVSQQQNPQNVDFTEIYNNENRGDSELSQSQDEEHEHIASMEIGDMELSGAKLRMLENALGNVRELVTAISAKIIAIEEEIDWDLEARDPIMAAATAADRERRKYELQLLKDNVAVISSNLEALLAKGLELGIINIDINPVENVIDETSAMLLMLQYDDRKQPSILDAPLSTIDDEKENDHDADELKEANDLEPNTYYEPTDVEITSNNFDPDDMHKRPSHWNDIRLKRVMVLEAMDLLEGSSPEEITEQRQFKIHQVEAEMIEEIRQYGHLLNGELISDIRYADCEYMHLDETRTQAPGLISPSLLEKIVKASILINSSNFSHDDPSLRPIGWQPLKVRRVFNKEEGERRLGLSEDTIVDTHDRKMTEEEEIMLIEVKMYGQVLMEEALVELIKALETEHSLLDGKATEFDRNDPSKRPMGWKQLRKDRVAQEEMADRMLGIEEDVILSRRKEREDEVEQQLIEEARDDDTVGDYVTRASVFTRGRQKSISLSSFISAANMTLEELAEKVVESLQPSYERSTPNDGGSSPAVKKHSVLSFVPKGMEAVNLKAVKTGLKKVVMKEDLIGLDINASNFDVNNPQKRPKGWEQVRLRRVMRYEEEDRANGIQESEILARRGIRFAQEEQNMIEEVSVSGRIRILNMKKSAPIFPNNFHSAYALAKTSASSFKPTPPPRKPSGSNIIPRNTNSMSRKSPSAASAPIAVRNNPLARLSNKFIQKSPRSNGGSDDIDNDDI